MEFEKIFEKEKRTVRKLGGRLLEIVFSEEKCV